MRFDGSDCLAACACPLPERNPLHPYLAELWGDGREHAIRRTADYDASSPRRPAPGEHIRNGAAAEYAEARMYLVGDFPYNSSIMAIVARERRHTMGSPVYRYIDSSTTGGKDECEMVKGRLVHCDGEECENTADLPVALRKTLGTSAERPEAVADGWLFIFQQGHWAHYCPNCSRKQLQTLARS